MRTSSDVSGVAGRDAEHEVLVRHIGRWLEHGVVSEEEAARIRAFEALASSPRPGIPPLVEGLAYAGTALAAAAGLFLYADGFDGLARGARIAIPAVVALALTVAGATARRSEDPAGKRFAGVLWLMATASVAAAVGVAVLDVADPSPWAWTVVGVAALITGGIFNRALPVTATQVAFLAGAVTSVIGFVLGAGDSGGWSDAGTATVGALSVWALGLAWVGAAERRLVAPRVGGLVAGTAVALFSIQTGMRGSIGMFLLLGVATGAALVVVAVWRKVPAMQALAGIGLVGYLFGTITYYLEGTVGVPAALFLAGLAMLGAAALLIRSGRGRSGS
jgi:hypothetical protein